MSRQNEADLTPHYAFLKRSHHSSRASSESSNPDTQRAHESRISVELPEARDLKIKNTDEAKLTSWTHQWFQDETVTGAWVFVSSG